MKNSYSTLHSKKREGQNIFLELILWFCINNKVEQKGSHETLLFRLYFILRKKKTELKMFFWTS